MRVVRPMARRLVLGSAIVATAAAAGAAPPPAGAAGAAAPPVAPYSPGLATERRCTDGSRSALEELGCALAAGLGPRAEGVLVAAALPAADRAVTRGAELSGRLAASVARALGAGARTLPGAPTLAEATRAAGRGGELVYVVSRIAGGEVQATADVVTGRIGFWDRVRGGEAPPAAHASAARRLDGELGAFLPRVPLVATRVERAALPVEAVALACDDLDADGALELVVVGRRSIQRGRVRGGRFAPFAEAEWASLAGVAPAPLREPIASVGVARGAYLDVGLTDRARAVRLPGSGAPVALGPGLPWPAGGCLTRASVALSAGGCGDDRAAPPDWAAAPATPVDAFAATVVVDATGTARGVVAWRDPGTRSVTLRDDRGRTATVTGSGASLALGDLDRDGVPELVRGLDTLDPATDALVVESWDGEVAPRERLRVPLRDGVRAVAACPAEDQGPSPVVVATTTGLVVVR